MNAEEQNRSWAEGRGVCQEVKSDVISNGFDGYYATPDGLRRITRSSFSCCCDIFGSGLSWPTDMICAWGACAL